MRTTVSPESFAALTAENHGVPVIYRERLEKVLDRFDPDRQVYHIGSAYFPIITDIYCAVPFRAKHPLGICGAREIHAEHAAAWQAVSRALSYIPEWAHGALCELIDPYTLYGFCGKRGEVVFTFIRDGQKILDPYTAHGALRYAGLPAALFTECPYDALAAALDEIIRDTGLAVLIKQDSGKRTLPEGEFEVFYATKQEKRS